jgi:hypothetical protein
VADSVIFKQLPKVINRPKGENSPNLVILVSNSRVVVDFISPRVTVELGK